MIWKPSHEQKEEKKRQKEKREVEIEIVTKVSNFRNIKEKTFNERLVWHLH